MSQKLVGSKPMRILAMLMLVLAANRVGLAQLCETPRGIRDTGGLRVTRWYPHGTNYAVAVDETAKRLASSAGETMRIYDLTVPAHPQQRGTLCLRGQAQGAAAFAEGRLLVQTFREDGLEIWEDTSAIGFFSLEGIHGFAVSGASVFAATYAGALVAIDMTTPQKPVERGRYVTAGRPAHVVLANGLAYLTVWQKGLDILDMTDPSTPRRVGGIADPAISYFAADGKRGVLGRWNSMTLDVYDLTDPKAPLLASSIETAEPGIAIDIRIRGDVAFIVGENFWDGVRTLDLADIRAPRLLGHFDPQAGGGTIAFQDHIAYVSGWTEGTHVVDFTDPRAPVQVDRLETPAVYADVAIDGDLALVANAGDGLRVLRISDHAITDLGATYTRGTFYGVAARNGYAFVGCEFEDFRIFQYSSGAPSEIASLPTPGIATRVVLDGDRAYIADGPGGLHVADISDPHHPRDLGAVATPGSAVDVVLAAGRAWVASGEAGVRIIDPALLREVGSIPSTLARGVAMHDGELLVSDDQCVRRFSLDGVERRHWCRNGSMLARMATRGSRAYVADLGGFVYALDAKQLVLLGTVEVPSTPDAVVATPDSIFVAAEDAGILMLEDAASRRRAARH